MTASLIQENAKWGERLQALVARLSDKDLARPVYDGWTVAGLLAHLAFWDGRVLVLLRKWKKTGVEPSPADAHVVNDAMRSLLLAIPPRRAAEIALGTADAVDREIEELDARLISEIQSKLPEFRLNRGLHRESHIADIEAALSAKK